MAQFRQRAGLAGESLRKGRIGSNLWREDFQGHVSVQVQLSRLVDRTHPTFAHQLQNFELRKLLCQLPPVWEAQSQTSSAEVGSRSGSPSATDSPASPACNKHFGQIPLGRVRRQVGTTFGTRPGFTHECCLL